MNNHWNDNMCSKRSLLGLRVGSLPALGLIFGSFAKDDRTKILE